MCMHLKIVLLFITGRFQKRHFIHSNTVLFVSSKKLYKRAPFRFLNMCWSKASHNLQFVYFVFVLAYSKQECFDLCMYMGP